MRELEDGLSLPANQITTMAPGGNHIMLMGLAGPLNADETLSLTLHFASSDAQKITVPIVKM